MEVRVKRAGLQTTVQDLGRPGFRADGVPLSGAMDRFALRVANLLVGNEENTAALEFTLAGPEIEFPEPALVAAAGADFGALPLWRPVSLPAGTVLKFGLAASGCRGYLAIAGGFAVSRVLGSASTFVRGNFGGVGRALRDGDVLAAPDVHRHVAEHWRMDPRILPPYGGAPTVCVLPGAQASEFGAAFFEHRYTVTAQSDRMGFRLKGAPLVRQSGAELRSGTVVPGTVQVPPDGQPIVLMADAQTIGGYPQIAHVISADLPLVAQLRPGDSVQFRAIELDEAHELTLARERALAMLRQGLAQKLG